MLLILLAIIAIPPVILSTCFAVELLAGLRPLASRPASSASALAPAVVIVPAHDEEISIAATVAALDGEAAGIAELLVVADNCSDRTAELARAAGARVIVRTDPLLRGKGFALAFARDALAKVPPSVVVIVDADCRIDRAGLVALIDAAGARFGPVQAVNLLRPDLGAAPFVQVSNFAFMIRNLIRQRGLQRIAGRVHLTGTGMAFPWALFAAADLGGASIVEDLNLGVTLASQGHPASLVEGARVWSASASAKDTLQQRERWEGGFLTTALPAGARGFWRSLTRIDVRGMAAAIDLCIPPLVVLGLIDAAAILILGLAAFLGGSAWPLLVVISACALAGFAIGLAWLREGRAFASAGAIAGIPLYALRKLPIYARLLIRGAPRDWVRTDRIQ